MKKFPFVIVPEETVFVTFISGRIVFRKNLEIHAVSVYKWTDPEFG